MEETINVKGWHVAIELEPLAGGTWDWSYKSESGVSERNSIGPHESAGEAFDAARSHAFLYLTARSE
ncbi:MAG: hypothetical protein V4645_10130 [Pseudomonadota bacterium]